MQLLKDLAQLPVLLLPPSEVVVQLLLLLRPPQLLHQPHLRLLHLQVTRLLLVTTLLQFLQLDVSGLDGVSLLLDLRMQLLGTTMPFTSLAGLNLQLLDLLPHNRYLPLPLGLLPLANIDVLLHRLDGQFELAS